MTEAIVLGAFLVFGLIGAYYKIVGWDKMLQHALENEVQAGESTIYEVAAIKTTSASATSLLSMRQGIVLVTQRRLLYGTWVIAPFWRTITAFSISAIADMETQKFLRGVRTRLTIDKKDVFLTERASLLPKSQNLDDDLVDAINRARTISA